MPNPTTIEPARVWRAYERVRADLLAERNEAGHWVGELSSSPLSTATAVTALEMTRRACGGAQPYDHRVLERRIADGLKRLALWQNADGGWGDTDRSPSNIATTMLVQAALALADRSSQRDSLQRRAEAYVSAAGGTAGLRRRYGRDKTFAVPILTSAALAGLVSWREVSPLPFELACLPHGLYRFLRLPVVSYAIPALVAIGQARHFHSRPANPLLGRLRDAAALPSLRVLERMQPASGGFLEATPLTSFVVMSLASIGHVEHPVTRRGVEFLLGSVRADGSWPIDSNLATWTTTLAVNALAVAGDAPHAMGCIDWLLDCQYSDVHPYTMAHAGGWAWTDLSGGVPDVDDTAGALLALHELVGAGAGSAVTQQAARQAAGGFDWLLSLQNSDGGWPTFCRGWGTLPFDRSGTDLTAHAIRALATWKARDVDRAAAGNGATSIRRRRRAEKAIVRGFRYLIRTQQADGSWLPLWFGNQFDSREENPIYGTSRVLLAYGDLRRSGDEPARRGAAWLVERHNRDGGWGGEGLGDGGLGASTVEETSLAVAALLSAGNSDRAAAAAGTGLRWLIEAIENGRHREVSPIGFYFAKLWYYEKLYPLVFAVGALGRAVRRLIENGNKSTPAAHEKIEI